MTAKEILKKAVSQIGVAEKPTNVVLYNSWFYGRKVSGSAYPWCAAFVSWVFNECGAIKLIKKSVSTIAMLDWFKSRKQTASSPKPGDVVFFNFGGRVKGVPEHVGIVEKVISKSVVQTIEGNTSDSNYRDGGMVLRRQRNVKNIVGYGRPKYETTPAKETPAKTTTAKETAFKSYKVKVTATSLVVRKSASTAAAKVKSLKKGAVVTVTGKTTGTAVAGNKNWLKVSGGYIAEKYVRKV
jgi:hypothetical protein